MRNIASVAAVRRGPLWIAVVAVSSLGAIALGGIVMAGWHSGQAASKGPAALVIRTEPSPAASPVASAAAVVPAASPAASLVAAASPFTCSSSTIGASSSTTVAAIKALRTGTHAGYDRLTVQFTAAQPANVELRPQVGAAFTQGASGRPLLLAGTNGVLVVMHGADLHTSYSRSTDIKTGYASLAEVRQVEDFEGLVQLGLGVNGPACYRASFLRNPSRLVIDIQAG